MRIMRFLDRRGQQRLGRDEGDGTATVLSGDLFGELSLTDQRERVVRVLAPVQPPNLFCVGLNYRAHAQESGMPIPEEPVLFMKPTTTVVGPGDAIRIPRCCVHGPEVDYECELAVVIGRAGRDIPVERALDHVLGYTAADDVSARRWQKHNGGQWIRGKSFDTFSPLGPVLVTAGGGADEIADPQNLRVKTTLNGQVMQDWTTGDMIFGVAQLVSFISRDTTLQPGTVILTGTPQGVGFARTPPVFLRPGDEVVVEIEKIGRLANPVAAA